MQLLNQDIQCMHEYKVIKLQSETTCTYIRFEALHGGISISFRFAATPCVYLNYCYTEVQVLKKNLVSQLVSRLSLSEIMHKFCIYVNMFYVLQLVNVQFEVIARCHTVIDFNCLLHTCTWIALKFW